MTLPSAINALATSYELVHYFEIAKPAIVAVDAAMLPRVRKALADGPPPRMPRIVVIEDGQHNGVAGVLKVHPLLYPPVLHAPLRALTPSF